MLFVAQNEQKKHRRSISSLCGTIVSKSFGKLSRFRCFLFNIAPLHVSHFLCFFLALFHFDVVL